MKITWYGHAAFRILTADGIRIIIDPYEPNAFDGALSYGKIADEADIVLTSHDHADHNYIRDIKGKFTHIEKAGTYNIGNVKIIAIPTYHDPSHGKERGGNLLFLLETDGLKVAHMGDLGHLLTGDTAEAVANLDVLILPVGGFYTIDPQEATQVVDALKPRITIPMHFKTEKCDFPIAPIEDFVKNKTNVHYMDGPDLEITKETVLPSPRIVVLRHAL